jgi:F-type H+-transporting ATPase subunit b
MTTELAQVEVDPAEGADAEAVLTEGATGQQVEVPIPTDVEAQVETPIGTESLFPPFDANAFASHLFWLAIAFGLLYFLVNRLVVPKVGGILEDRRDRIASDLGEASRLSRETDEVIAAYESELAEARHKAYAIAQERRDEIKAEIAREQAETEASLTERIADAEKEIAARRDSALAQVDEIAADAARAIVEQVGGMTVSETEAVEAVKSSGGARA